MTFSSFKVLIETEAQQKDADLVTSHNLIIFMSEGIASIPIILKLIQVRYRCAQLASLL